MRFHKVVLACVMLASLGAISMRELVSSEQNSASPSIEHFIIKELMPVVDPEMVLIRQMFVCADTRIHSSEMEPTLKGGITKTRVAVRSEKKDSAWLTMIGEAPAYRIYQIMTGAARGVSTFVPTLSWAGAEHVMLGTMRFGGYSFESDASFPLHFKLVENVGYVHLCGRGIVTTPAGQKHVLGDDQTVGDFILALTSDDQLSREAASEALGWLVKEKSEADKAVPALINALSDSAMEVRRNAAEALGRIGDSRAEEALKAALQDEDEWVREVVVDALKKVAQTVSE